MTTMTLIVSFDVIPTVVLPATVIPSYKRAWRQHPSVVVLGGLGIDNSTGVSAVECRR